MKILKEAKQEKLPIDFITQFVSKGWEEVGNLKASINGIKKEFTGTKDVENILQDLVDAYLIAIGQMELHLDKKDYVELPKDEELKEALDESADPDDGQRSPKVGVERIIATITNVLESFNKANDTKFSFYTYGLMQGNKTARFTDMLIYDENCDNNSDALLLENCDKLSKKLNSAFRHANIPLVALAYEGNVVIGKDEISAKAALHDSYNHLTESNKEEAEPVQAKKFEDENKTEIFTELPDYDVEVEQKGDKIEIELEPKDDEWPEPAKGDDDIEDAKRAIANGEISLGNDIVAANNNISNVNNEVNNEIHEQEIVHKEEKPVVLSDDELFNIDFDEPVIDNEKDSVIKNWRQFKNN